MGSQPSGTTAAVCGRIPIPRPEEGKKAAFEHVRRRKCGLQLATLLLLLCYARSHFPILLQVQLAGPSRSGQRRPTGCFLRETTGRGGVYQLQLMARAGVLSLAGIRTKPASEVHRGVQIRLIPLHDAPSRAFQLAPCRLFVRFGLAGKPPGKAQLPSCTA